MSTAAMLIEVVFTITQFVNALLLVPQVTKLFKRKEAEGLSIITFVGMNVIQVITFMHGCLHEDYLLMIGAFLTFIPTAAISFLIVRYNKKNKKA